MKMEIKKGKLDGFVEVISEVFEDDRGFLARIYNERIFKEMGLPTVWREESHHHTARKNILRGLYVQREPFPEGKLLRVIRGEMLWVSVDVRSGSKTFGEWDSVVLSEKKKNLLCTARGFAHGCLSLTDGVDLLIKSDNFFSAEHGVGFLWNDKDLNIDWQLNGAIPFVSERDKGYASFQEFKNKYSEGI
jgi:dTDP-4-dehydrorhamnose 3,5-epimerase